jgi:uncharacterized membrane protein YhaH (DUF805 family)
VPKTMRQAEQEWQGSSLDCPGSGFFSDSRLFRNSTIRVCFWSVLAVAYLGSLLKQPPGIYDEGLIVSGAVRILHGQLPYRDFNTGYPPGQFYTIAGVFSVFGTSLLVERIWDTLWRLAIVGFAIVLARTAMPRQRPHLVPLICVGLVTGSSSGHLSSTMSGVLPCLAAVWCAVRYLSERGLRWLFFSGIAAGVTALYRHDLAACVCGAVTVAICYQALVGGKRRWLQFPAVFWAGALLVVATPILYFWLSVPHDALVRSFIDFPKTNFAGRHLPLRGPWSLLAWCDFYLPLAIMVTAAITLRQAADAHRPTLILLLMTSVSMLVLATQRLDTGHAYPAIMFSMVLLCVCIPEWHFKNRNLLQNLLLSGAVLCYGFVSLFFWILQMTGPRQTVPPGIAPAEVRYSRNEPPNEIARAGPIPLALDQRQAVKYIQRHLLPGRPLYVGVATHGLEWYNDALFYFLADRPNATRFDMFVPGITTSAAVQSEILRDIRQEQTEYVVLFRVPPSHEPNLSSVDNGVRILDDAIRQDYIQVAEFGRYTIWHRKNL